MRCWPLCFADPTLKRRSGGGSCGFGIDRHCLENGLQVVNPEGLVDERWRTVLRSLIDVKFVAGQGDRRDPARRAMPTQRRALAVAQHQIRYQDINLPDRQERGCFRPILADGHIVTKIRQDSRHELTNWPIRLRQKDLHHWLPCYDITRPISERICFKKT